MSISRGILIQNRGGLLYLFISLPLYLLDMKRTKIVATIGPASEKQATLEAMIRSGMNVARLNFSHGTHKNHALLIKNIRTTAKKVGVDVGILADLQGPRIRLGELPSSGVEVLANSHVTFTTRAKPPLGTIPVTYANLHKDLKRGDRLLIADGTIEVVVDQIHAQEITTRVLIGGMLKSHKGMNVPTATLHIPPLTAKDKDDLKFALGKGVDFVALSFVMEAKNIVDLRRVITSIARSLRKPLMATTPIIVKVEKHEAVEAIDAIVQEADGIMVARGDLALEINQAQVPLVQRSLIEKCIRAAKPVIVATQMLESMTTNPRPTRAEISDVSHAVTDHTDATMLSGETAGGSYPVESVSTMASIITQTEESKWDDVKFAPDEIGKRGQRSWMGAVARLLSDESKPKCIVVASASGKTAQHMASFRPELPVIAAVPDKAIAQRLTLAWGVTSLVFSKMNNLQAFILRVEKELKARKIIHNGESYIVIASDPLKMDVLPNVIELRRAE